MSGPPLIQLQDHGWRALMQYLNHSLFFSSVLFSLVFGHLFQDMIKKFSIMFMEDSSVTTSVLSDQITRIDFTPQGLTLYTTYYTRFLLVQVQG